MTPKTPRRNLWSFFNPVDIRKGEGVKTLLMFLYFFLTIAVLYVLKPVRSSLFLEELGSQNLRYVYLGEGLFLTFVTWAYVQLAKRLPKKVFFIGVLALFISNLILFWWLFRIRVPYLSAFFYIWVACFSITTVTQFWTLANDIFDPLEAKRLFGLIISGGSAGGVIGGLLTNRAVKWMPTEDLLLFSSLLLGGCIILVFLLWQYLAASPQGAGAHATKPIEPESTRKLFMTMPYLWMLAGIVLLAKVASTMVDNQFNAVVELHLVGKEAKTAFFGAFSAGLNVVSFLMQIACTSLCLRLFGIGPSLALLPIGLTAASLAAFSWPLLATATLLKVFDGSMNYSIQQASKEVLYLPLSSGVRYRVKPVIDMLVYRVSKSFGGLLIIALAPLFSIPNNRIGILVVALAPFWLFLVFKMKGAYLALLREKIWKGKGGAKETKALRASEVLSFLYDEKSFDKLRSLLTQESTLARKLAATACLAYHRAGKDLRAARHLVGELIRREALEPILEDGGEAKPQKEKEFLEELLLREAEKEVGSEKTGSGSLEEDPGLLLKRVEELLEDPKQEMSVKREAARFLEHRATVESANRLLDILSKSQDQALRFLLIRTLLRIKERNPGMRWNRLAVKKEVLREEELYRRLRRLQNFYRKSPGRKEDFLEVALSAIADESLERIFRALGLLFPAEGIRIIHERLREHPEAGDPIRSHAIDLLQNLLGPEFYEIVHGLFDKLSFEDLTEKEAVPLLEEMLVSPDRWLSLMAHFLVTELHLERRWPGLARVSTRSFEPLDV